MIFLLFRGMNEKEFKTFQLRRLRNMSLILRGMKMWLEGYLYFYQPFLHETIALEIRFRLSALLFLSRIWSQLSKFIFPPYTSFMLSGKKGGEKSLLKGRKSWFCFMKLCSVESQKSNSWRTDNTLESKSWIDKFSNIYALISEFTQVKVLFAVHTWHQTKPVLSNLPENRNKAA